MVSVKDTLLFDSIKLFLIFLLFYFKSVYSALISYLLSALQMPFRQQ